MAKIPFTLEAWLKDKSQKVETRDGRSARLICTDAKADDGACVIALITDDGGEEAYQYFPDGRAFSSKSCIEDCADLFLVTPEPELSEFEESIFKLLRQYKECNIPLTPANIKADASMLWQDFEKYFFVIYGKEGEGDSALRSFYYKGLANGKADAMKEFEEKYKQAWFDEGKIAGKYEGLTEDEKYQQGIHDGKEEALKDLPRWKKASAGMQLPGDSVVIASGEDPRFGRVAIRDCKYITVSDIEKLQGLNEEE